MTTFAEAFAASRKRLGPGKTFEWNGKRYSTNRADDKPTAKAATKTPSKPAVAASPRPASRAGVVSAAAKKASTPPAEYPTSALRAVTRSVDAQLTARMKKKKGDTPPSVMSSAPAAPKNPGGSPTPRRKKPQAGV
jgi:hypothetical protein